MSTTTDIFLRQAPGESWRTAAEAGANATPAFGNKKSRDLHPGFEFDLRERLGARGGLLSGHFQNLVQHAIRNLREGQRLH